MEKKRLISVVTVVYNGEKYLENTIKSVLEQTYEDIEYIIIDGGSTDKTIDIIKKYEENIDYWISEPDNGIYDAMNKGIKKSNGDFINLLNCGDSYSNKNFLLDNYLKFDSLEKVYFCNYFLVDSFNEVIKKVLCLIKPDQGMSVCHQTMFIGKNIYKKLGLYNLNYKLASDYDYFLLMIKNKISFVSLNSEGICFLFDEGATTNNKYLSFKEAMTIVGKYYGLFSKTYLTLLKNYIKGYIFIKIKKLLKYFLGQNNMMKIIKILNYMRKREV